MARYFIRRGTPATVGALWPVDDRLLQRLATTFHRGIAAGRSASEALRQAQIAELDQPCCDWAALQLVGELSVAEQSF